MRPHTAAGHRFVEACEGVVETLRAHADDADRNARMPAASFAGLQEAGIPAAFVPEELGGWGLTSVTDWTAGINRLGRGDASVAIAINMHLGVSRGMASAYAVARAAGRDPAGTARSLSAIASGAMLISATATERGTDNLHPLTTAERLPEDGGWVINGHKLFVTMSPLATHLALNLRMRDEAGDHLATTMLPVDTPGVEPQDDWDALGMRGSGSQSIRLNAVRVPAGSVRQIGPWGRWSTPVLINRTLGNLSLVGAFLGIAEHARELALAAQAKQTRVGRPTNESPGVQNAAGEMEIELQSCRSVMQRTCEFVDEWLAAADRQPPSLEAAHALMKDYQCAKWSVNRGAIRIVDIALDLAGGAGFMASNPLSRLYRDVRAGPFMQPHAAVDIRGYVGQVALQRYPES